jgi:hypothetical protein
MLLHFLLHHRPSPEYVNLVNDNFYTALRYAKRSRLPHIIEILQNAGAHEEFPDQTILCAKDGVAFVFDSAN